MSASAVHILSPKWRIAARRVLRGHARGGRALVMMLVGGLFWLATYGILYRLLSYFQGAEGLGGLLAEKLLGLVLLTFLSILLLSNVIAGLSTFFLAQDLTPAREEGDEDEILRPQAVNLDDLRERLSRGAIQDAKSLTGVFLALRHLGRLQVLA